MASRTQVQLRDDARYRADSHSDNAASDAELNDYLNESISDLYDLMLSADSHHVFSKNAPVLTSIGDNSYSLPSDFYKLRGVDLYSGGLYRHGRPIDPRETATMAADPPQESRFVYDVRFDPALGNWYLFTYPAVPVANLAVVYVPEPPTLSADSDAFYGPSRWHEYVATDTAIKILVKIDEDSGPLRARLDRVRERVLAHMKSLDNSTPSTIRRVAHVFDDDHLFGELPRP